MTTPPPAYGVNRGAGAPENRQPPPISTGVIDTVSGMPRETTSTPSKKARLPVLLTCVTENRAKRCFQRSTTSAPPPNAVRCDVSSAASKLLDADIELKAVTKCAGTPGPPLEDAGRAGAACGSSPAKAAAGTASTANESARTARNNWRIDSYFLMPDPKSAVRGWMSPNPTSSFLAEPGLLGWPMSFAVFLITCSICAGVLKPWVKRSAARPDTSGVACDEPWNATSASRST